MAVEALPTSITAAAYRASNGELAWRRSDINAALATLAESGHAVLGGEVWVALGGGRWDGLVPNARGGPPGVWHWDTAPQAAGESWSAYCLRAADESARAVAGLRVEDEAAAEVRDRLYFNITWVANPDAEPSDAAASP